MSARAAGEALVVPRAAHRPDLPVRVHVLRTGYDHWHGRSGLNPFHTQFDRRRFQVDLHVVPDNDDDFPIRSSAVRACIRWWVQRKGMEWYKLSDLVAEWRAVRSCLADRPHVLHFLEAEHSAQFVPLLLRGRRRRPSLMATFHQPPELLEELLREEVVRALDHVTVVSPTQVPFFERFLEPERVSFIPLAIDVDYFRPANGRPGHRTGEGRLRCITVGHWLRDYETLRAVAERLVGDPQVEFQVVSPRVDDLVGLPNVTVHAGLSDDALRDLYRSSDLLVLPLTRSTANCALVEGMASGLPVVATDLPSVRAYVPPAGAALVPGGDPNALADAIRSLKGDPEARWAMGRRCRARAEELSWMRLTPRYEALYGRLAHRDPAWTAGRGEATVPSPETSGE